MVEDATLYCGKTSVAVGEVVGHADKGCDGRGLRCRRGGSCVRDVSSGTGGWDGIGGATGDRTMYSGRGK